MPERVIPVQCHAWSNRRGSATCSAVAVHRFVLLCLRLASRVLASPRPSLCSTSPCHRKAEHSSPTPPRICAHPARIETRLCEAMPDARHCEAMPTRCAPPQFRCCVSHRYACSCAHPCHAVALRFSPAPMRSLSRYASASLFIANPMQCPAHPMPYAPLCGSKQRHFLAPQCFAAASRIPAMPTTPTRCNAVPSAAICFARRVS